eukprot:6327604-Pyramimonas_sp.AAC.1
MAALVQKRLSQYGACYRTHGRALLRRGVRDQNVRIRRLKPLKLSVFVPARPRRAVASRSSITIVGSLDDRYPLPPSTLVCGDALMLLATELSSDRVPIAEQLPLGGALLFS